MADGRQLTPLEIQQAYLADCEAFAAEHPLPDWGRELLVNWGAVLTLLSRDVRQLAGKLDAYTHVVHALITRDSKSLPPEQHPALASAESLVKSSGPLALEQLRFLLRLQVLDLRYHELGGLYDEFAQAGHAYSIILTDEQIESATTTAPPAPCRRPLDRRLATRLQPHDRRSNRPEQSVRQPGPTDDHESLN
jgi:hypothetical protein